MMTTNPAPDLADLNIERESNHSPVLNLKQLQKLSNCLYQYPHYAVTKYTLLISLYPRFDLLAGM